MITVDRHDVSFVTQSDECIVRVLPEGRLEYLGVLEAHLREEILGRGQ